MYKKKESAEKDVPYLSRRGVAEIKKLAYHTICSRLSGHIIRRRQKQPRRFFEFYGSRLEYLLHPYNLAWNNERTVEVPIALDYIAKNQSAAEKDLDILEFGSVLRHYTKPHWKILDKYEKYPGVINKDIVDLTETNSYDLIISISTLEHVGLDDEPKPEKVLLALRKLKNALKPEGKMLITLPLDYNHYLDKQIFENRLGFSETRFLKRLDKENNWKETNKEEARDGKYDKPFYCANALAICYYERGKE